MNENIEQHDSEGTVSHIWNEEVATTYVDQYGEHPINRLTAERAGLTPDDCVLDIGCGSGSALRTAATIVTNGELIGVDPTPAMVRISQTKSADHPNFERMRFLLGGAEALPLPDNRATVCWAINSLHHWQDIVHGLAEVRRVIASNGRFVVVEEIFPDGHGFEVDEVRAHLVSAGFEIEGISIQETDDAQFNVLATRNAKEA
ncbi:MAG: class I SAM-dependent methyltransferase [Halopseudomonas aestusnigri]